MAYLKIIQNDFITKLIKSENDMEMFNIVQKLISTNKDSIHDVRVDFIPTSNYFGIDMVYSNNNKLIASFFTYDIESTQINNFIKSI